jgi:hypothetical protein
MRLTIIFIILILIFSSCKKRNETNPFIRTWYDTEQIIPIEETLSIRSDSTFIFNSLACQGGAKSSGKWKISGDSLILNSNTPKGCFIISEFVVCLYPGENKEIRTTIKGCEPNQNFLYSEFKNEIFYIKNDSLFHRPNKDWNCPDSLQIVFSKTKKVKVKFDRNNNLIK